ncbi:MAG: AtpZ/AtpI family protein [Candidatus Xenobia bacterium]
MPDKHDRDPWLEHEADSLGKRVEQFRSAQAPKAEGEQRGLGRSLSVFLSLGSTFVGSLVAGIFGGLWLDRRLGTNYWVIIGLLLGLIAGATGAWRLLQAATRS